jgi:hypothetical protein
MLRSVGLTVVVAVVACLLQSDAKRLLVPAETQLEVEQWFAVYADVVDHRRFGEYASLFDTRARPDYTTSGGRTGSVPEMREWLHNTFQFLGSQHLVSNIVVLSVSPRIDGGGAAAGGDTSSGEVVLHTRAMLHNPLTLLGLDAVFSPILVYGGWYYVDLVRDAEGNLVAASLRQESFYNNAASSVGLLVLLAMALAGLLRVVLCGSCCSAKNNKKKDKDD